MFQYFLLSCYEYTCILCCCTLNLDNNGTLMNTVVIRSIKYFILDMLNYQKGKHYKYYTSFYPFSTNSLSVMYCMNYANVVLLNKSIHSFIHSFIIIRKRDHQKF